MWMARLEATQEEEVVKNKPSLSRIASIAK